MIQLKIDKKNIDRLLNHLNEQRVLLAQLEGESQTKDLIESKIQGIELALLILGIEVR